MSYESIPQGGIANADLERGLLYEAMFQILGSTAVILPFGDPKHLITATTFKTVGEEQVTFTYSKDPTTWDTPPGFINSIPILTFDGVDEEADTPDAAFWSRVAGVFSIGAWVNLTDATSSVILSKYDAAGNTREWVFWLDTADKLQLILYDESVANNPTIDTEADVVLTENGWVFVVGTYDGSANASGISVYQDGAVVASTDTDDAAFVNLEDLAGTVKLGHLDASPASLFDGVMAGGPLGPFFVPLDLNTTPDLILRAYELGRRALSL